jgi:hypothetical protein
MTSRIEQLMTQKNLRSELSAKQEEQIALKMQQLALLEQKLQQLEKGQEREIIPSVESIEPPSEEEMLKELFQDPRFKDKLVELQNQSDELAQLEAQLENLKQMKLMMRERQDLVMMMSRSNGLGDSMTTLLEEEGGQEGRDIVQETANEEHVSEHGFDSEDEESEKGGSEEGDDVEDKETQHMQQSVEKMEEYLTLLNEQSEKTNQSPEKDEGNLLQLMQMLQELRKYDQNPITEAEVGENYTIQKAVEQEEEIVIKKEEMKNEEVEVVPVTEDDVKVIDNPNESMEDTASRIQFAIEEITNQLVLVKGSESLISNEQEREYYGTVVEKLEGQLVELQQIQTELLAYREIIESAKFEKEMAEMQVNNQLEEIKQMEKAISNLSTEEERPMVKPFLEKPVETKFEPVVVNPEPNPVHEQMKETTDFLKKVPSPTPSKIHNTDEKHIEVPKSVPHKCRIE